MLILVAAALTALAIRAFVLLITGPHFPLGEDMLGHAYKSTMLIESLRAGEGVPIFFPGWYAGSESFRYWPHLPYALLAVPLMLAPEDPGLAVIVVIVCGLVGSGLGVLIWRRRLGWPLALLGVVLGALLADPLRVAFAEGNLGRIVAQVLFLPELALALAVVRANRWHPWPKPAAALIAVAMLSVLCHAMMAAVAGAAIMLVLVAGLPTGHWSPRRTAAVAGLIAIGTALAGWWLMPSLAGGIAGNSGEAVRRLFNFDVVQSFNTFGPTDVPTFTGRARFYVGSALVVAAIAALVYGGRRGSGWPYLVAGLTLVAVTIDPIPLLYNRLPYSYLLWPIRMQSVGQALVLLGVLHTAADVLRAPLRAPDVLGASTREGARRGRIARTAAIALLCLIALDSAANLSLVTGRPTPPGQLAIRERLAATPGWREATLDLSRLGSSPTLLWRGREQLFGWGIQGARNMTEIVDLNEALERQLTPSVLTRLDWWGVDDAVLDRADPELEAALAERGFELRGVDGPLRHWGRNGAPRALALAPEAAIGVGRNTRAWAARFPQVVRAESEFIDDLRPEDLRRAGTLVLAWPRWRDRERAETLVRDYAAAGGRVIVELGGTRSELEDGTSRFLGVEALRVPFPASVSIEGPRGTSRLLPFEASEGAWLATRYVGEVAPIGTVLLAGPEPAVVLGTSRQSERISFVGLNLLFHALVTDDAAADLLIESYVGLDRGKRPAAGTIPLSGYAVRGATYQFALTLDRPQPIVIPVARHERMTARVDGNVSRIGTLSDAIVLDLPAGRHEVVLAIEQGGNRVLGLGVSVLGLVLAVGVLVAGGRPVARRTAIRSHGWLVALRETQRVDEVAVPSDVTAASGPLVVVLVEVTNLGKIPRPFDPGIVTLVGRHGRPFEIAAAETDSLASALGQLRPGADAPPAVPTLASLVYRVPLVVAEDFELIAERDAARSD